MRHVAEIDAHNKLALIRFQGPVKAEDGPKLLEALVADPDWQSDFDRLVIHDGGQYGDLDIDSLARIKPVMANTLTHAQHGEMTRVAHVCSNDLYRPIIEYWILMTRTHYPSEARLFESEALARSWLAQTRASSGPAGMERCDTA